MLTIVTFPSTTSPLNGFITTAVYSHWNFADPSDGIIRPVPIFVTATTAMMYLNVSRCQEFWQI